MEKYEVFFTQVSFRFDGGQVFFADENSSVSPHRNKPWPRKTAQHS